MPKFDTAFDPDSYAPVAERIRLFYERFPSGRIVTDLVARESGEVIFKALVYRDLDEREPAATGWAAEREGDGDVNEVACLENTETSAIGRALANLGFTASTRRPSREEMAKADRARGGLAVARRVTSGTTLQARANALHDLIELVALAERKGLPRRRVEVLRAHTSGSRPLPLPRVRRLELRLRAWLRRQLM
jgi:hypothetical protein